MEENVKIEKDTFVDDIPNLNISAKNPSSTPTSIGAPLTSQEIEALWMKTLLLLSIA